MPSVKSWPLKSALTDHPATVIDSVWTAAKAYILSQAPQTNILIISSDNQLIDDLAFFTDKKIFDFPAWETLPGENIPPSKDIVGKRLEILGQLEHHKNKIIVTSLQGALQEVPAKVETTTWKQGQELTFETVPDLLSALGYERTAIVSDKGQFAVRGGIIDIFPLNAAAPYRLEFFGDAIDEIRTFDSASQKSTGKTDHITLTPATEQKTTAQLLDYLPEDTLVVFDDLVNLEDHLVMLGLSIDPLLNHPKKLYFTPQSLEELSPVKNDTFEVFSKTLTAHRLHHPMTPIDQPIIALQDMPASTSIRFVTANASEERALKDQLPQIKAKTTFETGYLSSGIVFPDHIIYPYTEISHRPKLRRTQWRTSYHTPPSEFHELAIGDLVVHFHNGVGKYLGIESQKDHTGEKTEFMTIEYSGNSKLFVPLSQAHLISRYIGAREEHPPLDAIGGKKWHAAKVKAQQAIIGYARELLEVQAQRTLHGSEPYGPDSEDMQLFESIFPFTPTEDQLLATQAIKDDMLSEKAMDRLVCGDVGYGKTEVAMRAAVKTVLDGHKQVAVLVPTTVLAMQHYETFKDRMAEFPIRVGVLSRFVPAKQIKKTLQDLETGAIDIVIGTHRIISKDIQFKNLGLVIIDEEQRFGVRAKEHLKKIKHGINCLTMTATPIPRTLYMSLSGARDLSTINTPPLDRLPIKTIIAERDNDTIKNALRRELARGGQAYFIHNRVESIFKIAADLQKLVPAAKIIVAHGQMSSDEIDTAFHRFKKGEADILVATTLVENGIDIPNANTILIDRSHTFGLSDLYQLRGRVGRWNKASYAYFLVPEKRTLPEHAQKRLQALVESSSFGGGMKLAMRDLEIRGSGDILGTQQSGHLSQIGFHLYCKLLKRAMHALKTKKPASFIETKLEFPLPANLPASYIPETPIRLEIYHRLGDATTLSDIDAISSELTDRFGTPPPPVLWLIALTRIRLKAQSLHYTLLKFTNTTLTTDQQRGKKTTRQTYKLPALKSPEALEAHINKILF